MTGGGGNDIFVVKYDNNGALIWAKKAGGTSNDNSLGIAVDGSGNCYVTGYCGTATFGAGETNETTLTPVGNYDIFVAKYNNSGALLWVKSAGGTGTDASLGIALDGGGNSYVTGYFNNMSTFGAGESNQTTLTSEGGYDIFVAKYDNSGALLWAKSAGGINFDTGNSIAVDVSGNSYVTGYFDGTATFGAGESNETTLTGAGNYDIFVAKYVGQMPEPTISAVIFATNSVWFEATSEVHSGNVIVNDVSPGPTLNAGVELSVGVGV